MSESVPTHYGCLLRPRAAPASEARVIALETRLGTRFPEDYRDFLFRYNGGEPRPSGFRLAKHRGRYHGLTVRVFSSLHDGDISLETDIYLLGGRMPEGVLPIGGDPLGNVICLVISGDRRGQIWFWKHSSEQDPPTWSNMDLIADSFDEFMRGLVDKPA